MKRFAKISASIVGIFLILIAILITAAWAPDRPASQLEARWAPAPSVFVEVDGIKVHLRDEGPRDDRVPIVLLHGSPASLHTWEDWAQMLKSQRRVIRFDLPGYGMTGPFANDDYSMTHYVRFVNAVLDKLGVQRCILVGNSFGGWIAWETALAQPARVDKLVLIDSAGYPIPAEMLPLPAKLVTTPVLNRLLQVMLPRSLVEANVKKTYGDPNKVTPALVDRYLEMTLREGNRGALIKRYAQIEFGFDSALIAELKVPTLILWGRRDHFLPVENATRFRRDIAGSRLVVFDDLGHVPQEEDPARSLVAAKDFLGVK